MVDTIDRQMQEFFRKSTSFRSESRGGVYLIWTDDPQDFYNIRSNLIIYNQEVELVKTVEDILDRIKNKLYTIKALILDCPIYDKNEDCSYRNECIHSIETIRLSDPKLPLVFYTPNVACLNHITEKNPRLTPVLKGDMDGLLKTLGLKT